MTTMHALKYPGKTKAGKAISARNATTHGVFCRQTVLPHLGEDPAGYKALLDTLNQQLRPRNLMEQQYIELWTEASWKLRRLSRFEAQIWEDDGLEEDTRFAKIERLMRVQTSLRRQLDKAVSMLSQAVPNLFAHRTREDIQEQMRMTDASCSNSSYNASKVELEVLKNLHWPLNESFPGLDNGEAPVEPAAEPEQAREAVAEPAEESEQQICKNELPPEAVEAVAAPAEDSESKNCKNELPAEACDEVVAPVEESKTENCKNELVSSECAPVAAPVEVMAAETEGILATKYGYRICKNEPVRDETGAIDRQWMRAMIAEGKDVAIYLDKVPKSLPTMPGQGPVAAIWAKEDPTEEPYDRTERKAWRRRRMQIIEDLINSGTLSKEEKRVIMGDQDLDGWSSGAEGGIVVLK